jgi:hypothetical protein
MVAPTASVSEEQQTRHEHSPNVAWTSRFSYNPADVVFRIGHDGSQSGSRRENLTRRKKRRWKGLGDAVPTHESSRRFGRSPNVLRARSSSSAIHGPRVAPATKKASEVGGLDSVTALVGGLQLNSTVTGASARAVSLNPGVLVQSNANSSTVGFETSRRNSVRWSKSVETKIQARVVQVVRRCVRARRPVFGGGLALPQSQTAPMDVCTDCGPQVTEKALKFVERVLDMVDEMSKVEGRVVQAVATDSMFYVARRMLLAQQAFHMAGKSTAVDLGYHYTQTENMATIRSDGLMSSKERAAKGLSAVNYHGAKYGQGVYTATNPCAWHGHYGDVGLIVARLQGANVDFDPASQNAGNHDCVTVERDNVRECVVLASSQQCIPILQFESSQISRNSHVHPGNMLVNRYHVALQALVDEIFNDKARLAYYR